MKVMLLLYHGEVTLIKIIENLSTKIETTRTYTTEKISVKLVTLKQTDNE